MSNSGDSAPSSSKSRVKREGRPFLPDDIFLEILSWLPTKDVLRYRCVCRRWRDMISTNDFADLHTRRGMRFTIPMVLVESCRVGDPKKYIFLDKWWVPAQEKAQIHKFHIFPDCRTCFSQSGFLVLKCYESREIIILNPINGENVRIVVPVARSFILIQVIGIFFNPTLKEYCAIFARNSLSMKDDLPALNYTMLNLGCKPCWREIRTPLICKTSFPGTRSILFDEYLCWIVYPTQEYYCDIIEYNISTEFFRVMHGPLLKTTKCDGLNLDIFNIDGFLSLVGVSRCVGLVDVSIWKLKDRTEQLWTASKYQFYVEPYPMYFVTRAIAVVDGELLLQHNQKIFLCNLKWRRIRQFGKNNWGKSVSFLPHVIGLASLRNCQSKIYMEGEDESTESRRL